MLLGLMHIYANAKAVKKMKELGKEVRPQKPWLNQLKLVYNGNFNFLRICLKAWLLNCYKIHNA